MILAGLTPYYFPSVIPPLTRLHRRQPHLRYVLAGPVIEADEGDRVQAMLQDPALRSAIGHRARQKIEAQFTLEGEIDGHHTLYQSVAAGTGA